MLACSSTGYSSVCAFIFAYINFSCMKPSYMWGQKVNGEIISGRKDSYGDVNNFYRKRRVSV